MRIDSYFLVAKFSVTDFAIGFLANY